MKSITGYLISMLIITFFISGYAAAETVYVKGVMKITMRTGPGRDHKIIAMIKSGDSLEMLDSKNGWSHVKTFSGKEGWVLTRFITDKVPVSLLVSKLKLQNQELSESLENVKKKNMALDKKAKQSKTIEEAYYRLKKESADFITLEKQYRKTAALFKQQQVRISFLEKQLRKSDIKWFLSGSGVLLIGILLGIGTGKKRKNSLL